MAIPFPNGNSLIFWGDYQAQLSNLFERNSCKRQRVFTYQIKIVCMFQDNALFIGMESGAIDILHIENLNENDQTPFYKEGMSSFKTFIV